MTIPEPTIKSSKHQDRGPARLESRRWNTSLSRGAGQVAEMTMAAAEAQVGLELELLLL